MLDPVIKKIKSHKILKPITVRLQEYIEFANNIQRYSDAGFYEEVLDYIEELEKGLQKP